MDFHAAMKAACDGLTASPTTPNTRNGATNISGCRIAASRAASAASSTTIMTAATGTRDFAFTQASASAFLDDLSEHRAPAQFATAWTEANATNSKWRGRYVEFNLLYDRGTTSA